jgi:hypothetical protein
LTLFFEHYSAAPALSNQALIRFKRCGFWL